MAHLRPAILLTGFGAFPGVDSNATAALIPDLAEAARTRFPQHEVISAILPTEWSGAPLALKRLLTDTNVVLALHFGVAPEARGFQIELVGRNVCDARHDAVGALPTCEAVIATGPAMLASTLPAERIVARLLRGGFPCSTSTNAGTYLCNALMYHSLTSARARSTPFLSGFIHVPTGLSNKMCPAGEDASTCELTWASAIAGSIEIIAASLETAPVL